MTDPIDLEEKYKKMKRRVKNQSVTIKAFQASDERLLLTLAELQTYADDLKGKIFDTDLEISLLKIASDNAKTDFRQYSVVIAKLKGERDKAQMSVKLLREAIEPIATREGATIDVANRMVEAIRHVYAATAPSAPIAPCSPIPQKPLLISDEVGILCAVMALHVAANTTKSPAD